MERSAAKAGRWGKEVELKSIELVDSEHCGKNYLGLHDAGKKTISLASRRLNGHKALQVGQGKFKISRDGDVRSTLRHEYGHALHHALWKDSAAHKEWRMLYLARSKDAWSQAVSRYGATNSKELFAESFAAWSHPEYGKGGAVLPKEIANYLNKWLK